MKKEITFRNNDERSQFLSKCEKWPVWLNIPKLRLKVHRAFLSDGSIVLAYRFPSHHSYGGGMDGGTTNRQVFRLHKGKDAENQTYFSSYFDSEGTIVDHIRTNKLFAILKKEDK